MKAQKELLEEVEDHKKILSHDLQKISDFYTSTMMQLFRDAQKNFQVGSLNSSERENIVGSENLNENSNNNKK